MAWARIFVQNPKITTGALVLANVATQAAIQVAVLNSPKQKKSDKSVFPKETFPVPSNRARLR